MRKGLLLISLVLLSACAVRFPQVERIVEAFSEPVNPLDPILWVADIDGTQHELIPLVAEQGNVYVNKAGVTLTFDGFIVRKIELFNEAIRHIEFYDTAQQGSVKRQAWVDYRPADSWQCEPWLAVSERAAEQRCTQGENAYTNRREINASGEMVRLEQTLHQASSRLVLYKKIPSPRVTKN